MCNHCVPNIWANSPNEADSALNQEFAAAADNPQQFDAGFETQRESTGFANFGFDPLKAAELREKELARIAKELENEGPDFSKIGPYNEPKDMWE